MINKKVCLLGAFAVGKTALAERYARSSFSDRSLSAAGVKIRRKTLSIGGRAMTIALWDMEGKSDYVDVYISCLRGSM
jgi:GTPase SAR1 family protein